MSGQSDTGTSLLSDLYGFIRIWFQINCFVFVFGKVWILSTDRALLVIRRTDKISGKVSPLPYSPKITVAYGELRVYFAVQILPLIDWTWTAEMTLSLQVDLVLSDTASTSEP